MGRLSLTLFSFAGLLCCVSSMFGQPQYKSPGSPSSNTNQGSSNQWSWQPSAPQQQQQQKQQQQQQQQQQSSWLSGAYPPQQNQQSWNSGGYRVEPPPSSGVSYGGYGTPYEPPIVAPAIGQAPPSNPTTAGSARTATTSPKAVGGKAARTGAGAAASAFNAAALVNAAVMVQSPPVVRRYVGKSLEFACSDMRKNGTGHLSDAFEVLVRHRFAVPGYLEKILSNPASIRAEIGNADWACAVMYFKAKNSSLAGAFSDMVDTGCLFTCDAMNGPVHTPPLVTAMRMFGGLGGLFGGRPGNPNLPFAPPAGGPQHFPEPPFVGNQYQYGHGPAQAPMPFDPTRPNMAAGKPFPFPVGPGGQPSQQNEKMYGPPQPGNQYPHQPPQSNNQFGGQQGNQYPNQPPNNNQPGPHQQHNQYGGHMQGQQKPTQPPQANNNQPAPHPRHNQYGGHIQGPHDPTQPPQINNNQPAPHPQHNQYGGHIQGPHDPTQPPQTNTNPPGPHPPHNQYPHVSTYPAQPNNNKGPAASVPGTQSPPNQYPSQTPQPLGNQYQPPQTNIPFRTQPPPNQLTPKPGIEVTLPGTTEKVDLDNAIVTELRARKLAAADLTRLINEAIASYLLMPHVAPPPPPPPYGMNQNSYLPQAWNAGPQQGPGMAGGPGSGMTQNGYPPKDTTQVSGQMKSGAYQVNLGSFPNGPSPAGWP